MGKVTTFSVSEKVVTKMDEGTPMKIFMAPIKNCSFLLAMFCALITPIATQAKNADIEIIAPAAISLPLKKGAFGPDESFIKSQFEKMARMDGTKEKFEHHPWEFLIGRHDLNHDGKPELIVLYTKTY
jgi:hypothetical protein